MIDLLREVMEVAGRLGLSWWEQLLCILLLAVLVVVGKKVGRHLRSIEIKEPEPSPPMDMPEGGMPVEGGGRKDGEL